MDKGAIPSGPLDEEHHKWFQIRDLFMNGPHNYEQAYDLALNCTWWEAVRFVELCGHKPPPTTNEAMYRLLLQYPDDPLANSFAGIIAEELFEEDQTISEDLFLKAARLGDLYCQSFAHVLELHAVNFEWLENSVKHDERSGLCEYGRLLLDSKNMLPARQCFERAIAYGSRNAKMYIACTFTIHEPEKFTYLVKYKSELLNVHVREAWNVFRNKGKNNQHIIYHIGYLLDTYDNVHSVCMYDIMFYYTLWNTCTRKAVDAWTLVAKRLGLGRDIRKLIAEWVWASRVEGLYEEEPLVTPKGKKIKRK